MDHFSFAKLLIITGAVLLFGGLLWYFFGNKLSWLGNLPGDIRIEGENFRFYFPITTMILLSLLFSLLLYLIRRLFG